MKIPFENMPAYAKIWVYQTDKNLTRHESETIEASLNEQVNEWAAHGAPLMGAFKILHNRFVIIAVDETYNGTSGCSIDASTNWLKMLGQNLNINFFDRSIAYLSTDDLKTVDFLKVKNEIAQGNINSETIIFNNLVNTISDYQQNWKIKAEDSWLKKHFVTLPVE